MKNYSDLRATDLKLNVIIKLTPVGNPDIVVKVADNLYSNSKLDNTIKLEYQLNLTDVFSIEVELKNKIYSTESETAAIIRVTIDSIEIVPNFDYLASYINDHNYKEPTSYLGFNGKWILDINMPFYHWLHQITGQGLLIDK